MKQSDSFWPVEIAGNVKVCVQQNIQQMTSYVLLEQEDWFEDEMAFVRELVTPEMNAFDIGANHGVYALSMARKLSKGHIWAFEPTKNPAKMLQKSIELNGFTDRITLVNAGLSDRATTMEISTSMNSELNSLYGNSRNREMIRLESLDAFMSANGIECPIAFVKLDAEGEEVRILQGGQNFFSRQSPLVMFELKHGSEVNHGLIEAFEKLGYRIYRLLNDLNILIEFDYQSQDDVLNLFACKSDCAEQLAGRGLLAVPNNNPESPDTILPPSNEWLEPVKQHPYVHECEKSWLTNQAAIPENFLRIFSACAKAHDKTIQAGRRLELLHAAGIMLDEMLKHPAGAHYSAWLLKIHLLHIFNHRASCISLCHQLCQAYPNSPTPSWPFLLPTSRFTDRKPHESVGKWLQVLILEFIEYRKSYSSYFVANPLPELRLLMENPERGIEIDRRNVLAALKSQRPVTLSVPCQLTDSGYSRNSATWKQLINLLFTTATP